MTNYQVNPLGDLNSDQDDFLNPCLPDAVRMTFRRIDRKLPIADINSHDSQKSAYEFYCDNKHLLKMVLTTNRKAPPGSEISNNGGFKKKPLFKVPDRGLLPHTWKIIERNVISVLETGQLVPDCSECSLAPFRRMVDGCIEHFHYGALLDLLKSLLVAHIPQIFTVIRLERPDIMYEARDNWYDFMKKLGVLYELFVGLNGLANGVNGVIAQKITYPIAISSAVIVVEQNKAAFSKIGDAVVLEINRERDGHDIDRECVKTLISMFSQLRVYDNLFEPKFLEATSAHYKKEAEEKFHLLNVPEYYDFVESCVNKELSYFMCYVAPTSKFATIRTVKQRLINDVSTQLVEKGAATIFSDAITDGKNLTKMYQLFSEDEKGMECLKTAFIQYLKDLGEARMMAGLNKALVPDLLKLKKDWDDVVTKCFEDSPQFVQAQKTAFVHFINVKKEKPAELIAKFMDTKMKTVNKGLTDADFDRLMNEVIMLFRFISGKDVFEGFYKRHLSKRLILGRSASVDAEKAMLDKLRLECGPGFTSKLEIMFKDIEVSKQLLLSFKQYHEKLPAAQQCSSDFSFFVLTSSCWPVSPAAVVNIPSQLCELQTQFKDFYVDANRGRQLTWQHDLGTALLITSLGNSKKELDVTLHQALVLLMFNDNDEYTFNQILTFTRIDRCELIRTLIALVSEKNPILVREKLENARFLDDEVLRFNCDYKPKIYKIKFAQVQMRETEKEHQQTEYEIQQDRQNVIDAGIVRLMKKNQMMPHTILVREVISSLQFKATTADIKKRIETLVEREYLCRCEHDNHSYKYVA